MALYSIADLERLAGQGASPETSQDRNSPETFRALPVRSDIRQQAYTVLCMADDWMSRAEVARALGLHKTAWLNGILEALYQAGYVDRCTVHGNGLLPTFYYLAKREVMR